MSTIPGAPNTRALEIEMRTRELVESIETMKSYLDEAIIEASKCGRNVVHSYKGLKRKEKKED